MTVKLAGRIEGNGPPLLLMHGLFGSARNWYSVQRAQAKRWQVHAVDLRNHGASDWADTMTYAQMADDVLDYMDGHGIETAAVLGHSMGGKVAMAMALVAPRRIGALIAVDIAPIRYEPTLRPYIQAMLDVNLDNISGRRDAEDLLRRAVPEAGVRGFLLQNLVSEKANGRTPQTRWRWRINLAAIEQALIDLGSFDPGVDAPSALQCPVLGIFGEDSDYMNPPARAAFERWFPQAQLVGITNAGHWVHAEQPAAFAAALSAFLDPIAVSGQ